jgi:hypothetical protein
MRKTTIILLLVASTLALGSLAFFQYRQIQRLRTAEASPATGAPMAVVAAKEAPRETQKTPQTPTARTVSTTPGKDADAPPPNALPPARANTLPDAGPLASGPTNESPMSGIAKLLKNPGMKDMIRAQTKGQIDLMYGSLYKYLELPEADLETFKTLLLDKQMALVDSAMDMMNNAATPEERKAATDRISEITAEYDAQIKAFLNDDAYDLFQSFEATQPERMQVTMFKGTLDAADAITEEQEDKLIKAMHNQRTNFKFSLEGFGDNKIDDPSKLTPELIAALSKDMAKLQDQYTAQAASILTPGQLEQFKNNQEQQRAMQEMGMKMAAQMFGKSSEETPAKNP